MCPGFVINKGIDKTVTAVSSLFTSGQTYKAAIYNKKDKNTTITQTATCSQDSSHYDNRPYVVFEFTASQTDDLKEGMATIEIYDAGTSAGQTEYTLMVYRDDFAVIRKNSLQIQVASN